MKVGEAVEIRRKGKVKARGVVDHYEADDGYIGNPEAWCRVRCDDGQMLAFRGRVGGGEWMPRSRKLSRAWGYVQIVLVGRPQVGS